MSELDRHLTTEELSALLDDQLSTGEPEEAIYRAHLRACEQCQSEFADLRQTVQLLRSLPAPKLPRSFVLPADISWEVPEIDETAAAPQQEVAATPTPISLPARLQQRAARDASARRSWHPALRLVSSLVAVVGICFMLSTLQLPLSGGGGASNTSAGTANSGISRPQAQSTSTGHATPSSVQPNNRPHASGTVPGGTQHQPSTVGAQPPQTQTVQPSDPLVHTFAINEGPGRLRLGLLLLIIGGLGFYIFKQKYRFRSR
ncbi:anti-sigma factor family protein [Dictyobacter aurantiacus]|uniref:Zinc-finger domain-containing protein n=1 Tax=Dictyobacter aurantiacus TaxID=1936993 RepID=A0A401ZFS4_9CHLR|nr:hypothetical protein [Dictyobacter aurantiacus]GCE05712.1 hypothetical protein KDAU_30410 [Dictyobacter aurantiacus]